MKSFLGYCTFLHNFRAECKEGIKLGNPIHIHFWSWNLIFFSGFFVHSSIGQLLEVNIFSNWNSHHILVILFFTAVKVGKFWSECRWALKNLAFATLSLMYHYNVQIQGRFLFWSFNIRNSVFTTQA